MGIHLPSNKGVPINPYPTKRFEQKAKCITLNCESIFRIEVLFVLKPGLDAMLQTSSYTICCSKCNEVQVVNIDAPVSELVGGFIELLPDRSNGTEKKRKRNPKKTGGEAGVE